MYKPMIPFRIASDLKHAEYVDSGQDKDRKVSARLPGALSFLAIFCFEQKLWMSCTSYSSVTEEFEPFFRWSLSFLMFLKSCNAIIFKIKFSSWRVTQKKPTTDFGQLTAKCFTSWLTAVTCDCLSPKLTQLRDLKVRHWLIGSNTLAGELRQRAAARWRQRLRWSGDESLQRYT
jgi:hypothetical protein